MKISSVLGPVDVRSLGGTLIHEHAVTCCSWSMRIGFGGNYCEPEVMLAEGIRELKIVKEWGIDTVVDGTPINLGRDILLLKRVAEESGVNIIASSGFYHQEDPWFAYMSDEEIIRLLVSDCTEGMQGTEILPGILKCGVDYYGFTPFINRMLDIMAKVSKKTNLPVFCHTIPELSQGNEMLDIFERNGVPMNRVVAGHSGDVDDIDYLESMLKRGCYLGMDRFGIVTKTPGTKLENRVETICRLCKDGWADKLLIGHDYAPYTGFFPPWEEAKKTFGSEKPVDFAYFSRKAVPLLLEKGLKPEDIDKLLIHNPAAFFSGAS